MGRSDAVMEEVKNSIGSVNGAERTSDPSPLSLSIVGNGGIRMLQPCVKHQPGIDKEVRVQVPEKDGHESVFHGKVSKNAKRGDRGGSRHEDLGRPLLGEHGRRRSEVISDAPVERLTLVVELSSRSGTQQVERPANSQMRPDLEPGKSTISHGFVHDCIETLTLSILSKPVVFSSGRDVRLSVEQVIGSSVMLGVSVLPSKVRNQQELMHDESNNIVPSLRRRESSMSTLMGDNPGTSHDGSHPKGIK